VKKNIIVILCVLFVSVPLNAMQQQVAGWWRHFVQGVQTMPIKFAAEVEQGFPTLLDPLDSYLGPQAVDSSDFEPAPFYPSPVPVLLRVPTEQSPGIATAALVALAHHVSGQPRVPELKIDQNIIEPARHSPESMHTARARAHSPDELSSAASGKSIRMIAKAGQFNRVTNQELDDAITDLSASPVLSQDSLSDWDDCTTLPENPILGIFSANLE
jgi:hypothetical protein